MVMSTTNLGIVWIEKGYRYFWEGREIMKGKDQGMIEVSLSEGTKRRVKRESIRRWPVEEGEEGNA
jgi:hypothetical protein